MIRFGSVLALYSQEEDAAKVELGRRERRRAELVAERTAIADALLAAGRDVPHDQHEQYLVFWRAQQARIQRADAAIAGADTAIEEGRKALAEAHRKRTTIEKLRARDAQADARRHERREQRQSDERAGIAAMTASASPRDRN